MQRIGPQERSFLLLEWWLGQAAQPLAQWAGSFLGKILQQCVQSCLLLGPFLVYRQEENHRNVELEVILESLQMRKNEIQKKEVIYSSPNTPKMVGLEPYLMASIASKPTCCVGRSQNSEIHRNFQLYICYTVINRTLTIHAEGKHAVIQSLK